VLGLGDIVDGGGVPAGGSCPAGSLPDASWATQWTQASAAIDKLDGHVPYMLAIGNHDYDCEGQRPELRMLSNWDAHFGPSRYAGKPWWHGAFETGSHGNFYNVFTLGGTSFLVVALQFYPTNTDLAWANAVIASHATMPTIIITHSYLFYDTAGPGTATRVGGGDPDSAASYKLGPTCPETGITTCGNGNNGSDVWTKLVSQHANIALVLSGHFRLPTPGDAYPGIAGNPIAPPNNGVGYRTEIGPLGNRIDQVLSDYQGQGKNGFFGNGYLRLYTFKPAEGVIEVQTYSPSVDLHPNSFPSPGIPIDPTTHAPANFKTDAYNQFTLPFGAAANTIAFTPADGATLPVPTLTVHASASSPAGVKLVQLYVDGVGKATQAGGTLAVSIPIAAGTHRVTVQAEDGTGTYFKVPHTIVVQ
jgi:hypothetical protein